MQVLWRSCTGQAVLFAATSIFWGFDHVLGWGCVEGCWHVDMTSWTGLAKLGEFLQPAGCCKFTKKYCDVFFQGDVKMLNDWFTHKKHELLKPRNLENVYTIHETFQLWRQSFTLPTTNSSWKLANIQKETRKYSKHPGLQGFSGKATVSYLQNVQVR